MLEELDIRNLGPIREATIAPAAGMTAITGETGAGKSMLLSAIRLVSGGAAESSRVSAGADEAWAQAIFAPYALPDVRGPCSAASPYRVRCWGPSPANWLPFMARPIS